MAEAKIIHPTPDDLTVALSTWIIRDHTKNEIVWSKKGGGVGFVADNDGYLAVFEKMYPLTVVRWGIGKLRLEAVIEGAAIGRVASISAFWEAPDLETANQARKEIASGMVEPSFVTRTTKKNTSDLPIRTHTGTLQEGSGEHLTMGGCTPAQVGGTVQPPPGMPGMAIDTSTPTDDPTVYGLNITPGTGERIWDGNYVSGMHTLASALVGTLIQRQTTWIDRVRALAETFDPQGPAHCGDDKAQILRGKFQARFHVGTRATTQEVETSILYHLGRGNAAHTAYLDWFCGYQQLEELLLPCEERGLESEKRADFQDLDPIGLCYSILREMVEHAATLVLVEAGQMQGDPTSMLLTGAADKRYQLIKDCCNFIADKDGDYGQSIRRHGIKGLLARLFDKYSRFSVLCSRPDRMSKFESIEDTAKDLLCYTLMGTAFVQEAVDHEILALGA